MDKKAKTKLTRSKLYDLIYFETLKDKPVTSAQLAKIAKLGGGAR